MTNLLIKLFIKDSENVKNPAVREKYGVVVSIVGVICNALLFALKLIVGLLIHSVSVMADAFNNLSDAASSIVSFVGTKLANRPADDEHPFGHGRYEYVAALVVAFLVLEVGKTCLVDSISKIRNPETVGFSFVIVAILIASILVKLWLGILNHKLGRKIDSSVMKATSADAFTDMLITGATVASIIVGHYTGWAVDGYVGVAVSIFVLIAGINIIRTTLVPLIGAAVSKEECEKISNLVEKSNTVLGTHDLIVHNYGPTNTMATIHAEVAKEGDFEKIHEEIDRLELKCRKELGVFLVIHMDPIEVNNIEVDRAKQIAKRVLVEIAPDCSLHDFRMVNGEHQINLIFDLVVPRTCKGEKQIELLQKIRDKIREENEKYFCVITVEHSFIQKE